MLLELIDKFDFDRPYPILSAKVNNVSEGLKFRVYNSRDVEFLDYRSYAGRNTYCRSLSFLLCKSAMDVLPGCSVRLRRPVSKGYFCDIVKPDGSSLSDEDVTRINGRMHEIVDQDMEFHRHDVHLEDAVEMFRQMGYEDKVKILETSGKVFINYYTLGGTPDYFYDCLVPSAGYLPLWELKKYFGGMLLRVPDRHEPEKLAPFFRAAEDIRGVSGDRALEQDYGTVQCGRCQYGLPEGTCPGVDPGVGGIAGQKDSEDRRGDIRALQQFGTGAYRADYRTVQQWQDDILQEAERAAEGLRATSPVLLDG